MDNFLIGNEIILTTGIALNNKHTLLDFVKKLYSCKVTGIIINIGPHISKITNDVIDFCNEKSIALFSLPWDVKLEEVTRDFCRKIVNSEDVERNIISIFKDIIFDCNENGSPKAITVTKQTINLADNNYIGYSSNKTRILGYNSGITADKQVTDDATYQALKDDPDWWTTDIAYSRYNHDSAVRTINSLPDTSAYLASAGGTNTIKFKGAAGSKTDGGAINTLTEEEIAVATAKGWTVTLV